MFGRATIRLGIRPHSSFIIIIVKCRQFIIKLRKHRRERHRGCRGRIPGNIWSAGDEMSYILPKFVKIVSKLPAELMRRPTAQPAFALKARHRNSPRQSSRPSPYFARAVTSSTMHF